MTVPVNGEITCRHCGEAYTSFSTDPKCPHCDRYQDAVICPTCGQLARASLMPEDSVPSAAKPKKAPKE